MKTRTWRGVAGLAACAGASTHYLAMAWYSIMFMTHAIAFKLNKLLDAQGGHRPRDREG